MDDVALARAIHVIAVMFLIGGVAMVTTVLVPAVRRFKSPEERTGFFELVERRFARQSQVSTMVAGLSGFYMVYRTRSLESVYVGGILVDARYGGSVVGLYADAVRT